MKKNIYRRLVSIALIFVMGLTFIGCAEEEVQGSQPDSLTSGIKPSTTVALGDMTDEGQQALTDFGLRLAWHSMSNGENGLVSPVSVMTAFAMVANGAKGNTLTEIEKVSGMKLDALNACMASYWRMQEPVLKTANSIWVTDQERFTVEPDFLQQTVNYYDAEVRQVPMNDHTCGEINRWVKKRTDGMIPQMLNELSDKTMMVLINALAFQEKWEEPYEAHQVLDEVFLTAGGYPVHAKMLASTEAAYLENDVVTGVMKPYKGGKYAFVGLLPKEGRSLMALLDELDGESLQHLLRHPEYTEVQTLIPKFHIEDNLDLMEILPDMGMPTAFDSLHADFSGLGHSDGGNISIGQALHKTYLSLDEQGTKAAAATVIAADESCSEVEEIREVLLDRPFVYLLVDTETLVPFFIGTMQDPTGKAPEIPAGGEPMTVKAGGMLYQSTGKESALSGRCGVTDGRISSTVAPGELPDRDQQSNFGSGWPYQYVGENLEVNLGRHWMVFEPVK